MGANVRGEFFDAHAASWEERNYSPELLTRVRELVQGLRLVPGSRVLDVGCGTGVLLPYLREAVGPAGQVVGLDFSAEMLKWAARKEAGRVVLLWAPAESLPLIDGYLDTVVCFAAFPHFRDKAQVAREFSRILRPGGRAHVAHLGSRDEINAHHDRHPAVAGDHMPSANGMQALFTAAGFSRMHREERPGWYLFTAEKGAAR